MLSTGADLTSLLPNLLPIYRKPVRPSPQARHARWGEPVFDKLEADLAKAMLSLPATKAFEIGSGFGGILLTGRQHNDAFRMKGGQVHTMTNRSGGIQGGISNGETIFFRVAFKPTATGMHEQDTVS